jgi:hypothetical protein
MAFCTARVIILSDCDFCYGKELTQPTKLEVTSKTNNSAVTLQTNKSVVT